MSHGADARIPPKTADRTWMADASCIGQPVEVMFGIKGSPTALDDARNICKSCPVKAQCLDYAQQSPIEKCGMWGGCTPKQRRQIRQGLLDPQDVWSKLHDWHAAHHHGTQYRYEAGCRCPSCRRGERRRGFDRARANRRYAA